jgi:crotonobetainyl-CoA:carnitine CoA-transferase CaiB-like acyl-CoA transferase
MNETVQATGTLAGIKVVDLTRVLGGPYCTQILGDHGADVIKVEPPQGDEVRDWGPPFHEGDASYYIGLNRNKRSIALDLGKEEGREVLLRLLEGADVLIENYKPGSMERWELGYEDVLKAKFAGLVHCRISGFGGDGPLGGIAGYDAIVQAMSGMFSVNGAPESGPTRIGVPLVDMGTGLYSTVAILMALIERGRSGLGQFIDMTLYDCAISLMHPHVANYLLSGKTPGMTGNEHPNISPYDRFTTKTVDIFLGAGNERAFQRLCAELGAPELAEDERFASNALRGSNREALREALESLLADQDAVEICERLRAAGLAVGPVLDTAQVMVDPHVQHRGMAASLDWYRGTATPIKFSRTAGSVRSTPPKFAADTRDILAECGYDDEEIDVLVASGVLVTEKRR